MKNLEIMTISTKKGIDPGAFLLKSKRYLAINSSHFLRDDQIQMV
jgi:hypothetical protein